MRTSEGRRVRQRAATDVRRPSDTIGGERVFATTRGTVLRLWELPLRLGTSLTESQHLQGWLGRGATQRVIQSAQVKLADCCPEHVTIRQAAKFGPIRIFVVVAALVQGVQRTQPSVWRSNCGEAAAAAASKFPLLT